MLLSQGWVQAVIYYVVGLAAGSAALWLFQRITRFDDWKEIGRGNIAAALASGGQIVGLAHIIHTAIAHNESILTMLAWAGIGFVLQMVGYFLFDAVTPFKNDEEIANGNIAVGTLLALILVAVSHLAAAVIQ